MAGLTLAQVIRNGLKLPHKLESINTTSPPSGVTGPRAAEDLAIGKIPDSGVVAVEARVAETLTIYTYNPASRHWIFPGTDSGSYQKDFTTSGNFDFFEGPPGALFYIKSSSTTNNIYHSGDDI